LFDSHLRSQVSGKFYISKDYDQMFDRDADVPDLDCDENEGLQIDSEQGNSYELQE
jgi:hypothetical protein